MVKWNTSKGKMEHVYIRISRFLRKIQRGTGGLGLGVAQPSRSKNRSAPWYAVRPPPRVAHVFLQYALGLRPLTIKGSAIVKIITIVLPKELYYHIGMGGSVIVIPV